MYEQLRSRIITKLGVKYSKEQVYDIIKIIDEEAAHYKIEKAEENLVVYDANGMQTIVKYYIASRKVEGLSNNSLSVYCTILNKFLNMVSKPINNINTNDIRIWLYNYQSSYNVEKRTLELYRQILCGFFKWAKNEGYIDDNPCDRINKIKYTAKPRVPLEQIELEQLRNVCKTDREIAFIEVLYSTGCRISELINIKKSDIDFNKNEIMICGKGDKYRTVYLNARAIIAVKNYIAERTDDNDFLFVTKRNKCPKQLTKNGAEYIMSKLSSSVCDDIGKKITPHTIRHTTATTALENGANIQDIQKILGHSNINTTMIYAKVSSTDIANSHKRYIR